MRKLARFLVLWLATTGGWLCKPFTKEQGEEYLKIILEDNPEFITKKINSLSKLDELGHPKKYTYGQFGKISPTTLRYLKVASDLKKYFNESFGGEIAEIGGGYGGQFIALDQIFTIERYAIFDLFPICELITKYVESHSIHGSYCVTTINQFMPKNFDFCISNYAFSELPLNLQMVYFKKILVRSKRGYFTMNSGKKANASTDRLTIAQLQEMIPNLKILEERPLTGPDNYIVVWGI